MLAILKSRTLPALKYNHPILHHTHFHSKRSPLLQTMKSAATKGQRRQQQQQQQPPPQQPQQSRLRQLISKYGYSALGVYFGISVIDFGVSFALIHTLGQDKVREMENAVKSFLGVCRTTKDGSEANDTNEYEGKVDLDLDNGNTNTNGNGNSKGNGNSSTLLTELTIALALHKALIFVRVPAAMALTPPIVKMLQRWGYNVGKGSLRGTSKFGTTSTGGQRFGSWFF